MAIFFFGQAVYFETSNQIKVPYSSHCVLLLFLSFSLVRIYLFAFCLDLQLMCNRCRHKQQWREERDAHFLRWKYSHNLEFVSAKDENIKVHCTLCAGDKVLGRVEEVGWAVCCRGNAALKHGRLTLICVIINKILSEHVSIAERWEFPLPTYVGVRSFAPSLKGIPDSSAQRPLSAHLKFHSLKFKRRSNSWRFPPN